MSVLLRYFWLCCAVFWLTLIILKRKDLRTLVNSGRISETEMTMFRVRLGVAILTPCLLLGSIQILGDFPSPFHITGGAFGNPWVLATWGTIVTSWLLLLYWLWFRNGAEYLSIFSTAFGLPANPSIIRLGLTFVVLFSAMSVLLQALGIASG